MFQRLIVLLFTLLTLPAFAKSDIEKQVDAAVYQAMRQYKIPAISIAIIDNNQISYVQAYSINTELKVSPDTLFQSASIGKSVAAYGTLMLVQRGKMSLDKNINNYLSSWKVPENIYTGKEKVTLRNILSMTSGLSVPGFYGLSPSENQPTLKQILTGEKPAENPPVKVMFVPGSQYFYSGGSYEVLQQMMEDVTQKPFSVFMQENIFDPLAMKHSYFIAILPNSLASQAVAGYLKNGDMIPGRWKIIAALAAGGMWTTASDLAKFTINVIDSYRGNPKGLLSRKLTIEMLSRQKNSDFGLGFVIDGCGKNLNFRKQGHNIGFYNWLIAFPETGQGMVIMTNSENAVPAIQRIIKKVSAYYHWPQYYPIVDESQSIPLTSECERK